MTQNELKRGNELVKKIEELSTNISLLDKALTHDTRGIKRFFLSCKGKGTNEMRVEGGFNYFGDNLKLDRECMELLQEHFQRKLAEANAEFESIGKGGDDNG
jgi:hypothetical protein